MLQKYKKNLRHNFNKLALGLLLYEIIFQVSALIIVVLYNLFFKNIQIELLSSIGFLSILTGGMAIVFIYFFLGRKPVEEYHDSFSARIYIQLLLLFFGIQYATSILNIPIEAIVNYFGHSLDKAAESAGGYAEDIWIALYSIIFAPIYEELLIREVIYSYLRRYGAVFTALASASIFGMMHANVLQILYAFFIGLFLCYIREKYGLRYSILLHFSNNLIVTLVANDNIFSDYISIFFGIFMAAGIITLLLSLYSLIKRSVEAIRYEGSLGFMFGCYFTSPLIIITYILYIILALTNLD